MSSPITKTPDYKIIASDSGFAVYRNGTPFKTLAGTALGVPTSILAEAIAAELRTLTGKADPTRTPMLTLASTALDIVAKTREAQIEQIAAYAGSDLLCHRATEPAEFAAKQQQNWQPLLDWCEKTFNAPLRAADGVMPIMQPPESMAALRRAVASYDDFRLTGLSQAVGISGSIVLGLALIERHITADDVFAAAELDATHQIEKWGEDPAATARRKGIRQDIAICEKWFELL